MKTIRGKKAIVTGAASGIGRALALALAREGADLYLLDRDQPRLADVVREVQECRVEVLSACCDLAQPAEISHCINALLECWGRVDILVNNAGIIYHDRTEEMSATQWERLLSVNLLAPIQFIHELLPTMLSQGEAHILNTCSLAGLIGCRKMAAYSASKFGLVGLSQALNAEYHARGLCVTALCPGFVWTNMLQNEMRKHDKNPQRQPPSWACATPETVANCSIRAIYRKQELVVVPLSAYAAWQIQRHSPSLWTALNWLRKTISAVKKTWRGTEVKSDVPKRESRKAA